MYEETATLPESIERDAEKLHKVEAYFAALDEAYRNTTYQVETESGRMDLRLGQRSPKLERLLEEHGALKWEPPTTWAFLTAYNPRSVVLPPEENTRRQAELETALQTEGYKILPGQGVCDDAVWQPEGSVFVIRIEASKAFELGRKWQQNAIVYGSLAPDETGRHALLPKLGYCIEPENFADAFAEVKALRDQWTRQNGKLEELSEAESPSG